MALSILQIIATLFVLFALSRVLLRWKNSNLSWRETSLWSLLWISVLVVLWIPATVTAISIGLGLGTRKPIDTLVYISIVALFYLVYRGYAKQEQLEQNLTRLVRHRALKERKK